MQPRHVARIDAALQRLQPVAFLIALGNVALLLRNHAKLIFRQGRLLVGGAHVGPQHAAALDERIGLQLDLLGVTGFDRFGRHVDALARIVEFPAVIGTAQPAFLVAAEPERRAAMRTEFVDQAIVAVGVAEGDEALGQDLHAHRRAIVLRQLLRQQGWQPVAAEQVAHRGSRSGLRHEIVLFPGQHLALLGWLSARARPRR